MTLISKQERKAILDRFPKAEIVSTRHRYYLVVSDTSQPGRLLMELRGITTPPTRKDRARAQARSGYGYNRPRTY